MHNLHELPAVQQEQCVPCIITDYDQRKTQVAYCGVTRVIGGGRGKSTGNSTPAGSHIDSVAEPVQPSPVSPFNTPITRDGNQSITSPCY